MLGQGGDHELGQPHGEHDRDGDGGLNAPAPGRDDGGLQPLLPRRRRRQVARHHLAHGPAAHRQRDVDTDGDHQAEQQDHVPDVHRRRPLHLLAEQLDRDEFLGLQKEVARDDHGAGRDQQAGDGLQAIALEHLVQKHADGQADRRQADVARLADHEAQVRRRRQAQRREQQQVGLAERQAAVGAGRAVVVEADQRAPEREERQRAPREQAEAKVPDQMLERVRGRARARRATQERRVLAGHQAGQRGRQEAHARNRQQREHPRAARAAPPGRRRQRLVGGDVAPHAGVAQGPGAVGRAAVAAGRTNRQTRADRQRRHHRQRRQHDADQRARGPVAEQQPQQAHARVAPASCPARGPGEPTPAPERQRQRRDDGDVRRHLPRRQREHRRRAQHQHGEQRGPAAKQPDAGPVDRHQRPDAQERVEDPCAELGRPEHLHAQRLEERLQRLGLMQCAADGRVGQAAGLGHSPRPVGEVQLPRLPQAEGAETRQAQRYREQQSPRPGGHATEPLHGRSRTLATRSWRAKARRPGVSPTRVRVRGKDPPVYGVGRGGDGRLRRRRRRRRCRSALTTRRSGAPTRPDAPRS